MKFEVDIIRWSLKLKFVDSYEDKKYVVACHLGHFVGICILELLYKLKFEDAALSWMLKSMFVAEIWCYSLNMKFKVNVWSRSLKLKIEVEVWDISLKFKI